MDPAPRENGSSGSGALPESPIDALGVSPSQEGVVMPATRPGQSAGGPNGVQMWEALFHVWITLQSPLG